MQSHSGHEFNEFSLPQGEFYQRVVEEGLKHTRVANWNTDKEFKDVQHLVEISFSSRVNENGWEYIAFPYEQGLAAVHFNGGKVYVHTAAKTTEDVDTILEAMREIFPKAKQEDPETVSINFWALGGQGPFSVRRIITVPDWAGIQGNYTDEIKDELTEFMALKDGERFSAGQLILWQGLPGTGKTYALRALTRNWRKWCDFHYITDPEQFFGGHADYMLQVILGGNQPSYVDDDEEPKWNLLILEDSGELLAADAKQKTGQGLSRLLNVVDGLIGQGLRIVVLVTTNEELKALHPAVVRHGRCASRLEFAPLTPDESNQWLKEHGSKETVSARRGLSDLFAMVEGNDVEAKPSKVGFA